MEELIMKDIRELIYNKYIKPTEADRKTYVGVEIEMPIVNLSGEATSHNVSRKAFSSVVSELSLKKLSSITADTIMKQ